MAIHSRGGRGLNTVHLTDCMDFMADKPDNCYDLAIIDPPYGIGAGSINFINGTSKTEKKYYRENDWDTKSPDKKYFDRLFRISENQIIWGANHFIEKFSKNSSCWIFWNKGTGKNSYADGELAWTSFNKTVKYFFLSWVGQNAKERNQLTRIHPTQKPVALYKWLLKNYAKPGQTIFDSHVGSGSSRIACHDLGFDFEGCEIDPDYWQAQEDRYNSHIQQGGLFEKKEIQDLIYSKEGEEEK